MNLFRLTALLLASGAMGSRLYAASYAGNVTSLSLSECGEVYQLRPLSSTNECGTSPSWLMLDEPNNILHCLDEGIGSPNASLTSFKVHSDGSFEKVKQLQTLGGPVASAFYTPVQRPDRRFFAVAHYSGSAVTTYSMNPTNGQFNHSQTFTFTMPSPGPDPERQDAPHPHGVVVDPSGQFVLVPDLGADLVRIFRISPTTGQLEAQQPLATPLGSGPRHAVFWAPNKTARTRLNGVRFYLVTELDNQLRGYDVTYSQHGDIRFSEFYAGSTYGNSTAPTGSKAAEIAISPENDRILVSNRGDNTFGPANDSIALFSLGNQIRAPPVSFVGLYPSFGSFPRQFDISSEDGLVAIAQQNSHKVVVARWDGENGTLGSLLTEKELDGEITAVVWG